jgi:tetratricopeptide (TPR) repeat protein
VVATHTAAQRRLSARTLRVACVGALAVTTLALATRTAVRNHDYLDLERLWSGEVAYVERVIAGLREISTKVAWYHADAYVQLARAHLAAGKWDQTLALYFGILEKSPNNFKVHKWLGYAYYERQMFDEAIYHFRRVVELDPTAYSIHNVLGTLLCERGAIDEGINHLRRSVAIVPSYVWGHNNLGAALMLQGKMRKARRHFEQALLLAPVFAPAQENLKALDQDRTP